MSWARGDLDSSLIILCKVAKQAVSMFFMQDIASTLWAFAKLYHTAYRGLLPNVALHVLKLWARFTPTAIVTILESLAILQGCSLHIWTQLLAKLYSLPVASLTAENLWHLYHTFLILEASGNFTLEILSRLSIWVTRLDMVGRSPSSEIKDVFGLWEQKFLWTCKKELSFQLGVSIYSFRSLCWPETSWARRW